MHLNNIVTDDDDGMISIPLERVKVLLLQGSGLLCVSMRLRSQIAVVVVVVVVVVMMMAGSVIHKLFGCCCCCCCC
jgi:hypothetical protein